MRTALGREGGLNEMEEEVKYFLSVLEREKDLVGLFFRVMFECCIVDGVLEEGI